MFTVPRTAAPSAGNVVSVSVGSVLSTMTVDRIRRGRVAECILRARNTSQSPSLAAVVTQLVFVRPVWASGVSVVPWSRAFAVVVTGVARSPFVKLIPKCRS